MHIRRLIALSCMTAAFVRAADLNITYLASLLDQTPPCGPRCLLVYLTPVRFASIRHSRLPLLRAFSPDAISTVRNQWRYESTPVTR
ncbi:uncharacterized protein RSE6_11434 [Rhynchosporium secalis]|uniref:Secreted protein n=1 Tax=Rhynchosporium secalis TaxID=38038 RepID=A0A1E1MMY8_RHYSE|nr:uncharacterized protein RSE6_11434 [Rhynchosporium secalis]